MSTVPFSEPPSPTGPSVALTMTFGPSGGPSSSKHPLIDRILLPASQEPVRFVGWAVVYGGGGGAPEIPSACDGTALLPLSPSESW